jgi:hypothetical protein
LTESQRALVAARLKPQRGKDFPVAQNSASREKDKENRRSEPAAAELMKISRFSLQAADKVQKQGVEPLVAAVEADKISVSAAARIAALPAEKQQTVLGSVEQGLKTSEALARVQDASGANAATWVDDEGHPLPDSVVPAFRERQRLDQLRRRVDGVARHVERLKKSPAAICLDLGQVSGSLKAVGQALAAARPSRLCRHRPDPGVDCAVGQERGWIPAGREGAANGGRA